MTTGALIFAFTNEHTDYVAMAAWCARNVKQHLGIPVAVVTNVTDHNSLKCFDRVIHAEPVSGGGRYFSDYGTHVTWFNAGRPEAYDLSPWDQTLVLDADFVVNSQQLKLLFDQNHDFICFRDCIDATDPDRILLPTFGRYQMPMWWATVMLFRRSPTAEFIFDSMKMIRNHWNHYRDLYGISEETYRNDYALSIALGIVSGHEWKVTDIPWAMWATLPDHDLELHNVGAQQFWIVNYQSMQNKPRMISFSGVDFHAMGKLSLGEVIAHAV